MKRLSRVFSVLLFSIVSFQTAFAAKDTLKVMAYNALYYGSGCQGPNSNYHEYLKKIVSFTNPDILSLEKMAAIKTSPDDKYGTAPYGFADSIIKYALNAAFPGRYAHCTFTNNAHTNNMAVIFYDEHKLGFIGIISSYVNITDFNTYKFYYKDPALSRTHDTTFLYIIPNHDLSGDENKEIRAVQIGGVMKNLRQHFTHLPNIINMGDFNVRNSDEPFYQELVATPDTGFRFSDPPFFPDRKLKYPADWDHEPAFADYFTTSTRESGSIPNTCGTGGGAKNWYDHIFLSSWIVNGTNYIKYIPGSYRTIGNDGQRLKVSINNSNGHVNSSAPADVIEALYQMSNKYPVMVSLEVTSNDAGKSITDPDIAGGKDLVIAPVTIGKEVDNEIAINFPAELQGQDVKIKVTDAKGEQQMEKKAKVKGSTMHVNCKLKAAVYTVKITGHHNVIAEEQISKK